jgi:hypothetical protein
MEVEAEGGQEESVQEQQQVDYNSDESSSGGVLDMPIEEEAMDMGAMGAMGAIVEIIENKSSHSASYGGLVPIE